VGIISKATASMNEENALAYQKALNAYVFSILKRYGIKCKSL